MCVSSVVVEEIKRIIKLSEIMKYAKLSITSSYLANILIGKTTRTGPRKTRMEGRSWKSEWVANTFLLRYELIFAEKPPCSLHLNTNQEFFRLPRLVLSSMSQNRKTPKDCASSTTSSKI